MSALIPRLTELMANTYAIYIKTQNYHWHVRGPHFPAYHGLFEKQYDALAEVIDDIAERLLALGAQAPGTFTALNQHKTLPDGDSNAGASEMVQELGLDHRNMAKAHNEVIAIAAELGDEGTVDLLGSLSRMHDKMAWMLEATAENS